MVFCFCARYKGKGHAITCEGQRGFYACHFSVNKHCNGGTYLLSVAVLPSPYPQEDSINYDWLVGLCPLCPGRVCRPTLDPWITRDWRPSDGQRIGSQNTSLLRSGWMTWKNFHRFGRWWKNSNDLWMLVQHSAQHRWPHCSNWTGQFNGWQQTGQW